MSIRYHDAWSRTIRGTPVDLYQKNHTASGASNSGAQGISTPKNGAGPLSISKGKSSPILFVGGVHGDEPEGVRLALELLARLSEDGKQQDFCDWLLIPCINPDGYLSNQRTNSQGVDLNRNFPTTDWTAEAKAPRYSPGPSPASEKETQILCDLIEKVKPGLVVHFHSWEPSVVYTGEPGKKWAEMIGEKTGYKIQPDIGYPTPGSLGKYGWLMHQVPVICVESQEKCNLNDLWPIWGEGLLRLCREFSCSK
ncbi:MAG: DUF2817 domain-containing protein [Bdellovibrionota bacterium]